MPTHLGIIRSTCMEQVVDSHPVLGVYAAPEWHELTEDAQQWAAVLIREARRALAPAVPADVAALVVAAREVLDEYGRESVDECQAGHDTLRQLDKAAKAFASRVCWGDEDGSLKDAHAVPCTCGLNPRNIPDRNIGTFATVVKGGPIATDAHFAIARHHTIATNLL